MVKWTFEINDFLTFYISTYVLHSYYQSMYDFYKILKYIFSMFYNNIGTYDLYTTCTKCIHFLYLKDLRE